MTTAQPLPDKPNNRPSKGVVIGVIIVAIALIAGIITWTTKGRSNADESANPTVRIGTTEAGASFWPIYKKKAAEQGINIEPITFNDYNQPNRALAQKQLDLNYFQHIFFLTNYNVENNDSLIPLEATYIVPLGLHSKTHDKLSQIPSGGNIAIPNDATNQGRALLLLQSAGLIKLNDGGSPLSTPADIDASASKVKVTPVDAAQTVTSLPSVDGAVINNNFANDAGIDPKAALFADSAKSDNAAPYINVFAARPEDKNNETLLKAIKIWHDPEVAKAVLKDSNNSAVLVKDRSQAELQHITDGLQADLKKARK